MSKAGGSFKLFHSLGMEQLQPTAARQDTTEVPLILKRNKERKWISLCLPRACALFSVAVTSPALPPARQNEGQAVSSRQERSGSFPAKARPTLLPPPSSDPLLKMSHGRQACCDLQRAAAHL